LNSISGSDYSSQKKIAAKMKIDMRLFCAQDPLLAKSYACLFEISTVEKWVVAIALKENEFNLSVLEVNESPV
jgi:hypothetical protein